MVLYYLMIDFIIKYNNEMFIEKYMKNMNYYQSLKRYKEILIILIKISLRFVIKYF